MKVLPQKILEELRQSAIPDRLTLANIQWVEGQAAITILAENALTGRNSHGNTRTAYVTASDRRLLDRYEFASAGMWVAYGQDIGGNPADVAYAKPIKPRKARPEGFGGLTEVKTIKYETPAGLEAKPILPWVDEQTASEIYQRYGVTPTEGEDFWAVVWRCDLPICVTEGLKKAAALIAKGIPTIALRGICNWHKKQSDELHEAIAHFATQGRQIYICFDQDSKQKTVRAVETQIDKFAKSLERRKCKVSVVTWDNELGKGIDDVIYRVQSERGEDTAQSWVDETFVAALTYKTWKTNRRTRIALEVIRRLNRLSFRVERATEGKYMPQLPTLSPGAIHILSATMNSGKTVRIGADWVQSARAAGWNTIVLTPLNSLGQQCANDWELPHIHLFGTSQSEQQALWSMVAHEQGIVMCGESLHRLPEWFWQKPTLLILDEGNQTCEQLVGGQTLGKRWQDIMSRLSSVAQHAICNGAIIVSEDGITDRTVEFVRSISGQPNCPVRVFTHRKQSIPWDCQVFSGQASGFRHRFVNAAQSGQRLLFVTTSQAEGKRVDRVLQRLTPNRKVVRIDSETNENGQFRDFFDNPDKWLEAEQPDILILSPSAKSGISIQGGKPIENAYFSCVWGHFSALETSSQLQLLGRFRPPVPRYIFVPDYIQQSGDEGLLNPRAIARRIALNSKAFSKSFEVEEASEATVRELEIEAACLEFTSKSLAVVGNQKSIARAALIDRLETSGHIITEESLEKDKGTIDLWKEVQEEIWREDAERIANLEIDPERNTLDWAYKTLDSNDASLELRTKARKVIWRSEFPGVDFNDSEECYEALCRDYGKMRRGVLLQARAENLEASKSDDRKTIESILKGNIRALHRLPKNHARALLIARLGVLELLDGNPYSNLDSRAIAVRESALKFAKEISYWLEIHTKPDQTAVEICNKLMRKLGLEIDRKDRPGAIEEVGRPGKRGEHRDRVYRYNPEFSPVRTRLLEASRRKLSESVSVISNIKETPIEITDTPPKIPMNEELAGVAGMLTEFSSEGILDSLAMKELTAELNPIEKRQVWEQLTPDTKKRLKAIAA